MQNNALSPSPTSKIVQRLSNSSVAPPTGAITLEVLKLMETHLQRRNLLPSTTTTSFRYLWFVAETERNVFLWRNQLSLGDAGNFDFWVIVDELVQKRVSQLEQRDSENPFTNPVWGESSGSALNVTSEIKYLEMFHEIYKRSAAHAHALCKVMQGISKEMGMGLSERVPVVLPRSSSVKNTAAAIPSKRA